MSNQPEILCIGEILWDALPSGLFLGGAPLNVCYHLNQLGLKADFCSRIGDDRLGKEALRRIKKKAISVENLQVDEEAETGFVEVEIGSDGEPTYEIMKPVAWDFIDYTTDLKELAQNSSAIVFGTLAQRHHASRAAIQKLWEYDIQKIIDLNFRPPHVSEEVVRDSLEVADVIKMNKEEMEQLQEWYALPKNSYHAAVEELASQLKSSLICITHGANGALLYQDGLWVEHEGYPAKTVDSVGAGDAFLAALIFGLRNGETGQNLLALANAAGSHVAQFSGATPEYSIEDLRSII